MVRLGVLICVVLAVVSLITVLVISAVMAGRRVKLAPSEKGEDRRKNGLYPDEFEGEWPFRLRTPLTPSEITLYFRLARALPEYIILPQVQLTRVVDVQKDNDYLKWFSVISRYGVDFLVCDKRFNVLVAVELDTAYDLSGDDVKERALAAAGICLLRWPERSLPAEHEIRREINNKKASLDLLVFNG